jgi:hypothetical protein
MISMTWVKWRSVDYGTVMPGLVPGIHAPSCRVDTTWMPAFAGMTTACTYKKARPNRPGL